MKIDKKEFISRIVRRIKRHHGKTIREATPKELYVAVADAIMDYILDDWLATKDLYAHEEVKQIYYFSAEFLMGRAMSNNLINMCIYPDVKKALEEIGFDYNLIEDQEADAGLGNGGLGRLAACFLDSLATQDYPGHGYGIRYKYGMFRQKIVNGRQTELPEDWLLERDPWSFRHEDEVVTVKFGGEVHFFRDENGKEIFRRMNAEEIRAIPYDTPIVGYDTRNVNTLRLWEAESPEGFDLGLFNRMQYRAAVEKQNMAEDISRVLYPNDEGYEGKVLRIKQQYFFVSASLQDIVAKYKKRYGPDWKNFAKRIAIQLNDTHPAVAIPELMRILLDWQGMEWNDAWEVVTATCAYTNHTILSEALERWPVDMFSRLLPRVFMIIEEINRRHMQEVRKLESDSYRQSRMSIIGNGTIRMAWLAIVGSHSVNGVAKLHTEILKTKEMADWYAMFPKKFNNKTNGVTQRRFLLKANPALAAHLSSRIGLGWVRDFSAVKAISEASGDDAFVSRLAEIKAANKRAFCDYWLSVSGVSIDPDRIFDVQVKRLHEYKRQLLNALNIIILYNRIKADPSIDMIPRNFIFGAKAASGYRRAKSIIHLLNALQDKINADPAVSGKLKVYFLENYRVTLAERLIPAADVSEQISTAGKEASGTGNMKFMMNGALTIGTLDGANIEIAQEAGRDNCFIFGLTADEIAKQVAERSYNPQDVMDANPEIAAAVKGLVDGTWNYESYDVFKELYDSLVYGVDGNPPDQYFVLADLPAYMEAQANIDRAYRDAMSWQRMALANIAGSWLFSSDRTIAEYAKEIWDIRPIRVK
jgi:glycogen phosphorylase